MTSPRTTQDAASEYLDNSQSSSGNGHGNGHVKAFSIKPAIDPATQAILESRERAARDERLTRSMFGFYVEILDRSLDPDYYLPHPRGVVTLSDTVLAEVFRVSNRTIYNWKKAVEACEYFWLTQQFRRNMWPITTYHLTCLHRPPRTKTDRDGTYGSGGIGRSLPVNVSLGARKPGQPGLPLPGSRQKPPEAKSSKTPEISGLSRKELPVSPETNFGSDPKPISGETRNPFRVRPETSFGSDPKPISGETRNQFRVRPETDFRHIRVSEGVKEPLETKKGGEAPPPDEEFEKWIKGLEGMFPSKLRKLESDLKGKLSGARSDKARQEWKRRLQAVQEQLVGGKVEDEPKPPLPATPEPKPAEPTPEEILEGARYLVSVGKAHLMTKAQKEALKGGDR